MDRLLEATYRVEQQHFWWKGLRSFVRPLVATALSDEPDPRILGPWLHGLTPGGD